MSQFSESHGAPAQEQGRPGSIFTPPDQQLKKLAVSNLTKNLMSSSAQCILGQSPGQQPDPPRQPPSYSQSVGPAKFEPEPATSLLFNQNNSYFQPNSVGSALFSKQGTMNYIPLGHNTPTAVLSSYTSNYSYTPSFHSASGQQMGLVNTKNTSQPFAGLSSFLSGAYKIPGAPTTNISMDLANTNTSAHTLTLLFNRHSFSAVPPFFPQPDQLLSLPGLDPFQPPINRMPSDRLVHLHTQLLQPPLDFPTTAGGFVDDEPDHYMTYKEYLGNLIKRDANATDDELGYEEHLNIVDFPVDELITMLACLLTKIIEANDKLHPNHFDNTIAVRQKMKEEKKARKLERRRNGLRNHSTSFTSAGISTTVEHIGDGDMSEDSSDDEEDELKNRYLANVLAFHGTNIPGITLHAYLTRVLKYCPVTNEVFLSLLVYFDRIAKRANNLKKKRRAGEPEDSESEQLFVMDLYNIHRLIILGITVSSKFFSDIFYKNLRYAKVGGLPLEELNYLELQFLLLLDFKLMISVEDLQNYGDLLLKFWKREQLASEIVNGGGKAESERQQDVVPEQ